MKISLIILLFACMGLLASCTYEGIRMQERHKCAAMPETLAERCYNRTRMSREEYDAEREKLRRSEEIAPTREDEEIDPRYDMWIP